MGSAAGRRSVALSAVPRHFDVVHAGASVGENSDTPAHLDPIPLLIRDGVLSLAIVMEQTGAGMA